MFHVFCCCLNIQDNEDASDSFSTNIGIAFLKMRLMIEYMILFCDLLIFNKHI